MNTTPYNIQKYLEKSKAHQDANTKQSTRIDSKQLILQKQGNTWAITLNKTQRNGDHPKGAKQRNHHFPVDHE